MSDETLHALFMIAAIAIYNECGLIEALKYLQKHGYTYAEGVDIIALYDKYADLCKAGNIHILMGSPKL